MMELLVMKITSLVVLYLISFSISHLTGVRLPGGVPIHRNMKLGNVHIVLLLLAAGLLAGACTRVEPVGQEQDEIRFRVDGWQEATKAGAVPYAGGTISSGSFGVTAYSGGTTTPYFANSTVNYVSSAWEFADGKHYWPASGTLDFHAWMPTTKPSYITDPTYSRDPDLGPGFTCRDLPLTSAGQEGLQEYVYAYETGKSKADNGASGVTLAFHRPFTLIEFRLALPHPGMTLNSITITGVKNNGTYTHSGDWTPTGESGSFVATYNTVYDSGTSPIVLGQYLVMPQSFGTQHIAVNVTVGGNPATTYEGDITLSSWQAGHSYIYTFLLQTNFIVTVQDLVEVAPNVTTDVSVQDLVNGGTQDYTFLKILNP